MIYGEPLPVGASCAVAAFYFKIQIPSMLLGHCHLSLGRADQSSKQELTRASITASTYAHLDVEQVRAELSITTAQLLGTNVQESKVDKLVREIEQLSEDERRELLNKLLVSYT